MEVCKEITICTAHMLSGHNGLCKNLHGHNYTVRATIMAEGPVNSIGSSAKMIIDFGDLKVTMFDVIESNFDHAIAFSGDGFRDTAEEELLAWAKKHGMRHFVMPDGMRTTAEDMSNWIANSLADAIGAFDAGLGVRVEVWETPTSVATSNVVC